MDILLSHVADLKNQAEMYSMITNTLFLDLPAQSELMKAERFSTDIKTFYYGGYDGAERVIASFVPSFFNIENISAYYDINKDDNPLCLIKITKDKFSSCTHRDYLGSLMGLGLKRECIGDIIVTDEGAFVVVAKTVAGYITENLNRIGKANVSSEISDFSLIPKSSENFEEIAEFISSPRLDSLISVAFSISRSSAVTAIEKGMVYVDGVEINKPDKIIKEGTKLVLRGKGKAVFSSINGQSKKGRLHITIKRYL